MIAYRIYHHFHFQLPKNNPKYDRYNLHIFQIQKKIYFFLIFYFLFVCLFVCLILLHQKKIISTLSLLLTLLKKIFPVSI